MLEEYTDETDNERKALLEQAKNKKITWEQYYERTNFKPFIYEN